jgi:HNH endonuclease
MKAKHVAHDVFKYIDMHGGNTALCWEWLGPLSGRDGRAYFTLDGKRLLAYRHVYTLMHGVIPEGMVVRHKCDNEVCCNPTHLELGTQSDNMRDASKRDRTGQPEIVVKTCRKLVDMGWTHQSVADLFEISRESVTCYVNGTRKGHYDE